ncbi:MAG TPA: hypothetical protein VMD27_06100 [Candidatus Aquilonibacter sp.]|nr:hypothetical protein [Candidatus Aquilonibacter sp.]
MADQQAQVTSVDAIEAFRAALVVFVTRARAALEEVSSEAQRVKVWLESDQRRVLDIELRQRGKKLEQAQQELFSARISAFQESTSLQQMTLQRAQRAMREMEDKMARLKKWDREIESRSDPLVKQVEQLHNYLSVEMPKAIALLVQTVRTLDAYSDRFPVAGQSGGGSAPAAPPEKTP